jgi:hypothetical protein
MQQNKRGGNNWIGFVVFFVLVLGSRIFPPLANWLTQISGVPISSAMIYGAVIVLGLILPAIVSGLGSLRMPGGTSDTRLPTQLGQPTKLDQPPMPAERLPDWMRTSKGQPPSLPPSQLPSVGQQPGWMRPNLPSGQAPRLGKPQFEPIIDPRVLTMGLLGFLGFGLIFGILILL